MANNKLLGIGFHHIAIQVKDFDREAKFFEEGLGLRPYTAWNGGANGEKRIMLMELGEGGMVELFSLGAEEEAVNNRYIHFALHVDDVEAAYERAIAAGAEPVMTPSVKPLASAPVKLTLNCAFVRAPGGEEIEFIRVLDAVEQE